MGEIVEKKKYEKAEDFIGWRSKDGLLEVIDIYGKQGNITTFKVICHKCKEDKELFPLGYFISNKANLERENKPCGCGKYPKWNADQCIILAKRKGEGRFIVHGFAEEFHGAKTKMRLQCIKDNYVWYPTFTSIQSTIKGCPKCAGQPKLTKQEALNKCKEICDIEGYEPIGFIDGYINVRSLFKYKCHTHGEQTVKYYHFTTTGSRCMGCWKEKQLKLIMEIGNGNGYYPDRKDEQDYLYVLNFNDKFIKVGRSFNINKRIISLRSVSKIKRIKKLRIFTATHQEIYDIEQEIIQELKDRGFQYYVNWTKETFENDSLPILNKLLDVMKTDEI